MNPPESALPVEWEVEAADPEVGFLSDSITHTCAANIEADTFDVQDAEVAAITRQTVTRRNRDGSDEQVVAETTTFRCPACGATTAMTEHWPLWFFEEDRSEDR
jgi:hypothetical protein